MYPFWVAWILLKIIQIITNTLFCSEQVKNKLMVYSHSQTLTQTTTSSIGLCLSPCLYSVNISANDYWAHCWLCLCMNLFHCQYLSVGMHQKSDEIHWIWADLGTLTTFLLEELTVDYMKWHKINKHDR